MRLANLDISASGRFLGVVWRGLTSPGRRLGAWAGELSDEIHRRNALADVMAFRDRVVMITGSSHPDHQEVHPDNLAAATRIMELFQRFRHWTLATVVLDSPVANRLVLGSPTSTAELGLTMGVMAQPGRLRPGSVPVRLAYAFGPRTGTTAKRYVGQRLVDRQLTSIYDVPAGLPLSVNDGRNGDWLRTDYLLVTRLPNILNEQAYRRGFSYVSVAGVTGVGTKACALLMNDAQLLDAIRHAVGPAPYFQVLLSVGVEHMKTRTGGESLPIAGSIKIVGASQIEVDQDRIEDWIRLTSMATG